MADEQATTEANAAQATPQEPASSVQGLPPQQDATTAPVTPEVTAAEPTSEETATPQLDDDIDDWAAKKGISVETDNERKLAQIARDNQRDFTRQQQASKLDKSLEGEQAPPQSGLEAQMSEFIAEQRREKALSQFKEQNPDWKQHEDAMAQGS